MPLERGKASDQNMGTITSPKTARPSAKPRAQTLRAILAANGVSNQKTVRPKPAPQGLIDGGDFTDQWTEIRYHKKNNGDGTLPDLSAKCPGLTVLDRQPARTRISIVRRRLVGRIVFRSKTAALDLQYQCVNDTLRATTMSERA